MKDLVIIGAGGFGRETLALVEEINEALQTNLKMEGLKVVIINEK